VLLNDPASVEAARSLAGHAIAAADRPADRALFMLRRAVGRVPAADEVAVLVDLVAGHQAALATDPEAVDKLLAVGTLPLPAGVDRVTLAAWTSAARAVLNLQETYTRP
jgi:hypothetical protein